MRLDIYNYFLQLNNNNDKRQQILSVSPDRRAGDRRNNTTRLNNKLYKDIVQINGEVKIASDAFNKLNTATNSSIVREIIAIGLSPFPFARRIMPIEQSKDDNNTTKAVGLGLVGAINMKEDVRDILTITGRTKVHAPQGWYAKYGFFLGTLPEEWLKKTEWGKFILREIDGTLADTNIAAKVLDKLGVKYKPMAFKKEIKHFNGKTETVIRKYVKLEGSRFGRTLGLTLYRMPKLSLLVMSGLEIDNIIKAKKGNKLKQTANSAMNVVFVASCGALCSALLAPVHPALAVMGLGVGYYLGSKLSKSMGYKLNRNIQSSAC